MKSAKAIYHQSDEASIAFPAIRLLHQIPIAKHASAGMTAAIAIPM
jgi:hypothetical protein